MHNGQIKHIAVIGAGTMGQGIAQLCATSGYSVMLYDVRAELIHAAITAIEKKLESSVQKGKLGSAEKSKILERIKHVDDFRQLQVDLVIEAVIESLEVKQKIFLELENINAKDCLLTTNTSSIPITQIAAVLKHKERFAGLHFFNPAPVMKLVEVIKGASTSGVTIENLQQFVQHVNKQAVLAQDSPGFIVNRVARHFYVEALKLAEEGVADFESIDQLMRSAGFKLGPFELMDLIGVDTNLSVTKSMFHAFYEDPKFRPSRTQQQKVDAGHLGKKSGKGFYTYSP